MKLRLSGEAAASSVNNDALLSYLTHLEALKARLKDEAVSIDLTHLLALPGVIEPATDPDALLSTSRPIVLDLLGKAAERLNEMRATEGRSLAEDLMTLRGRLLEVVGHVAERAPVVVDEYHDKLTQRVGTLMAKAELKVGENELIKEVAVFADRCDIAEEIARLRGHLDQFEQVIAADDGEPSGRTLDFLAQEMLREANTIGSKSNDAEISRHVVNAKSLIDRIKEQVQNVE